MSTTTTPLMNLVLPDVGVEPGPDWASELNTAFELIDSHNHTSGEGSQVPTDGININADLTFGNFNATALRTTRFQDTGGALALTNDKRCLYSASGDLFYNNSSGTAVQITSGGGLNAASIGGIGGDYGVSTASVSYSDITKTFTFTQSPGLSSKMDTGDINLREVTAGGKAVTLKTATTLAADYTLKFFTALPGSSKVVSLSSTGQLATGVANSVVTADITDSNVTTAKIADDNVTQAKMADRSSNNPAAAGEVAISDMITESDVTGSIVYSTHTVTITTTGRPVFVCLVSGDAVNENLGELLCTGTPASIAGEFIFKRDSTRISTQKISGSFADGGTNVVSVPCSSMVHVDVVLAGTYTYAVGYRSLSTSVAINYSKLVAYEL